MAFFLAHKALDANNQSSPDHSGSGTRRIVFWPGLTIASFSPLNCPSNDILVRRLGMCAILALDTFVSVLCVAAKVFSFSFIPRLILAVLSFVSTAWLLHLVGRMIGERIIFRRTFTRWHFDICLLVLFLWNIALVGWFFGGLTRKTADVWWSLDILQWFLLLTFGLMAWYGPLEGQLEWNQV